MTKPYFDQAPTPRRRINRTGMWTQNKADWVQYEGMHEGRTVWAHYIDPDELPDGSPDLKTCEVKIEPYDGVL